MRWDRGSLPGPDMSTRSGVIDEMRLDDGRERMEEDEYGCGIMVCSWGELLSDGGAEQ